MDSTTLDVRAYAALLAALASAGPRRAEVLAAHGLDEEAWEGIDDAWQDRLSGALDDDGGDGVPPLVAAFSEAYAAARAAREGPPMPLERFAALTRRLDGGAEVEDALREAVTDMDALVAAGAYWPPRIARDEAVRAAFEAALSAAGRID